MSEPPSLPASPALTLKARLIVYLVWWLLLSAMVTPLAVIDSGRFGSDGLDDPGVAAWSTHVLILSAVLVLSVKSLVVAFQLGLLAAILQGYFHTVSVALWSGQWGGDQWDEQIQFALMLGLSAALSAVMWLLVRVVWKMVLSPEAMEVSGRSGQLGLREMLYVMASLSAFLAFVSLFSLPGLIPVEQVLGATILFAAKIGPLAFVPFWLAAHRGLRSRHWIWVAPLTLLYVALLVENARPNFGWLNMDEAVAMFFGIIFGTAAAVAANAVALHLLGLTWRQGGAATSSASLPAL